MRKITVVAASVLAAAAATHANAAGNLCSDAGATAAVGAQAFGSGARVSPGTVAGTHACVLAPKGAANGAAIAIVLWPATGFSKAQSEEYQGQVTTQGVTGFGPNAVFISSADHTYQHLWFKAGSHAVEITSDGSSHAPPAKLLVVARAVRAHLS
jgi:hypothetical protein